MPHRAPPTNRIDRVAAAPIPAPAEAHHTSPALDFPPAEHYVDPIWDTVLMNNIAQHIAATFLSRHLKGDATPPLTCPERPGLSFEILPDIAPETPPP